MTEGRSSSDALFDFSSPVEPWVVVAHAEDGAVRENLSAAQVQGIVRHLDPARMTDTAELLDEFAEKLEFPSYFGRNWYALVDCLDDLHGSWHGGRPVVVVVEDIDALAQKDFFSLFVALLCEAAERANRSLDADGLPRDRPRVPLHFVFFVRQRSLREVLDALRSRDDIAVREVDGRALLCAQPD